MAGQRRKSSYVFVNERGHPFGRMGIARMIERAGEAAKLPFAVHVHMLQHSTGTHWRSIAISATGCFRGFPGCLAGAPQTIALIV